MKTKLALTLALVLLAATTVLAQAVNEKAGVVNTVHDFNRVAGETCANCHSIHAARADASLLWARALSAATFTTYDSASLTVAGANSLDPATIAQEEWASFLCMSCHDDGGVTDDAGVDIGGATKTFPGMTAADQGDVNLWPVRNDPTPPSPLPTSVSGVTTFLDTQLAGDHPVNIEFSSTNPLLETRTDAETAGVKFYDTSGAVPTVQCGSCHNPHELNYDRATGPDATWSNRTYFIRNRLSRGEDLCLACHL